MINRCLHKISLHASAVMLMIIYAVSSFFLNHRSLHTYHDHAIEDTGHCNNDPCHLSIYHPGSPDGCNHKFHFTKGHPDCNECHHVLLPQENVHAPAHYFFSVQRQGIYAYVTCPIIFRPFWQLYNKGPPQVI